MIGHPVWFLGGAAAGATGAVYVTRKLARAAAAAGHLHPVSLARSAGGAARAAVGRVAGAAREGVAAARRRETELRAERDGRLVRLSDHLTDDDEVVVDGEPVDSAKVIVLRRREPRTTP